MSNYPVWDKVQACEAAGTHKVETDEYNVCKACNEYLTIGTPTNTWTCGDCGATVERYRGEYDVSCECGAQYNASGQRLRDDWRRNPSWYDDEISDLDGYEMMYAGDE